MATTSYATQGEFLDQIGVGADYSDVPGAAIDTALIWASSRVNSYIKKRVTLPLISWSEDIKVATCQLAAKQLIDRRGIDYSAGNNQTIQDNAKTALDWLKDVSKGLAELDTFVDSAPTLDEASPLASSDPLTDWDYTTRESSDNDEC
jgi:phage gp36-like protein